MPAGLPMGLEDNNCWTRAEAAGHATPDRLQHFPARASWEEREVTAQAARGAIEHLHDGGHAALLVRRHRYTGQTSFHRCWSPRPVPPARLVHVATCRWRIEEDHQRAKQTCGLVAIAIPNCSANSAASSSLTHDGTGHTA